MPKVPRVVPPSAGRRLISTRKSPRRLDNTKKAEPSLSSPHSSPATSNTKNSLPLSDRILQGLTERADAKTKVWFTNYVKGTTWIGCKVPVVRATIKSVMKDNGNDKANQMKDNGNQHKQKRQKKDDKQHLDATIIMDNAIRLLQHPASDAKLAGMLLLSEQYPPNQLATLETLDRFDQDLWQPTTANNLYIADWSTADWFAIKVLSKMVFYQPDDDENMTSGGKDHSLQLRILSYACDPNNSLWQRRCGIVAFLQYDKHPESLLPEDFGVHLMQACEDNLLASPQERFAQTGIAWVLRYVLTNKKHPDGALALEFVERHGSLWTTEAKKSFCEKLSKSDPRRTKILGLSSS